MASEARRRKGRKFDWTERFEHAGKAHVVEGRDLDMSGERAVKGIMKKSDPELWRAELALIGNTVERIEVDNETKWKSGDSSARLPSEDDPITSESTGDLLLKYIVTKHQPEMADKYPEAFEEYYDESILDDDDLAQEDEAKPTTSGRLVHFGSEEESEATGT